MNLKRTILHAALFVGVFAAWVNYAARSDARFEQVRAEEEAEEQAALASRQWAARQVCGENGTGVWKGDELQCLRTGGQKTGRPVMVAGGGK